MSADVQQRPATVRAMGEDLILWGRVLLQGATGEQLGAHDEREPVPKIAWTRAQEDEAWATDQLVNTLDAKPRIVLRVFYKAREARYWHELEPDKQAEIEGELCREVNARWRVYCATVGQLAVTVRAYQLRAIREAAIQELCQST